MHGLQRFQKGIRRGRAEGLLCAKGRAPRFAALPETQVGFRRAEEGLKLLVGDAVVAYIFDQLGHKSQMCHALGVEVDLTLANLRLGEGDAAVKGGEGVGEGILLRGCADGVLTKTRPRSPREAIEIKPKALATVAPVALDEIDARLQAVGAGARGLGIAAAREARFGDAPELVERAAVVVSVGAGGRVVILLQELKRALVAAPGEVVDLQDKPTLH